MYLEQLMQLMQLIYILFLIVIGLLLQFVLYHFVFIVCICPFIYL